MPGPRQTPHELERETQRLAAELRGRRRQQRQARVDAARQERRTIEFYLREDRDRYDDWS